MKYIDPPRKLIWHKDRLDMIAAGMRPMPVNVEIDLSFRCSLGCAGCHFAYTHTKGPLSSKNGRLPNMQSGGDLMDTDLAIKILTEFGRIGIQSVTWSGGGEPTLHPDFEAITLHAYLEGLQQGLYTHGGHIDSDRASHIKQVFSWIVISMDEAERGRYKYRKKVDKFKDACLGVNHLVKANGEAVIGLSYMLDRSNFYQVHNMIELGQSLGVDYVQFRPLVLYDLAEPNRADEDTSWVDQAIGYLKKYSESQFVQVDLDRFRMYRDWQGHDYQTCYWSGLQTTITPNGKVWICANKREFPGAALGDMTEETFSDIWQRHSLFPVDDKCRVLCRGHIPNLTAKRLLIEPAHSSFI